MTVGEFFLDEGRGSEECERTTIGDERSVASGQPTIDWTDNDDDITATVHLPETTEKSTEIEYLNKEGDVLSAKNCQEKERKKLIYKIIKTVTMVIAPAVMALFLELVGPTLLDLMMQTGSNFEEISRVLVARSVGILFGSLLGGILTDKFPTVPELFMSLSFIVGAVGTCLVPWMRELTLLGLTFHVQGLAFGFFDVCNNHLCIKMWQDKASCPIHALHFGYGLGALVAPQLARPFVITEIHNVKNGGVQLAANGTKFVTSNMSQLVNNGTTDMAGNFTTADEFQSRIAIPYLISAAIAVLFTVVFCLFYVFEKYHRSGINMLHPLGLTPRQLSHAEKLKERRFSSIVNPGSCTGGDSLFGLQFFFVAFFLFFNAVGGEHAYTKFIYTYAREGPLGLNSDSAAMVNTLFWICFMAGRGVAIFASRLFHPRPMLIAQLIFVFVSSCALCVWGQHVELVLWSFTGLLAMFLGPIMPAGISWCNRYVLMKGTAVALVFLATGSGSIFYQWLTGYLFQYRGAVSLMYVIFGFALFISIDFAVLMMIVRRRPELFDNVITAEVDEKGNISMIVADPVDEIKQNDTR